MSVMACDRNECTNIMCDHYSSDFGYICNECLDELRGNDDWLYKVNVFMNSPKRGDTGSTYQVYLEAVFQPID